jgi:ribonuclease HII
MTPRDGRKLEQLRQLIHSARGEALKRLAAELADDDREGVRSALRTALAREKARTKEHQRLKRLYALEAELHQRGFTVVAGVDEVGRGALAGPLTAGACVLPQSPRIEGLNDSKLLTPERREEIALVIREVAVCWSVGHVSAAEVDALGMTAALRRAVGRAIAGLEPAPEHVVVDGHRMGVHDNETNVIKGDSKVAAVSAASILAKVTRDALMREMAPEYPQFLFDLNKGYGTSDHWSAIRTHGLCCEHRRSFMPGGGTESLF